MIFGFSLLTVVCIEEPTHPYWSQDSQYYSHKYGKAGINYELGIAIATPRLVWMNGPFKAGTNDVKIFKNHGLRQRLLDENKKAIGDKGYTGHTDAVSFFNRWDSRPVKKFKTRALLKRHETFNNLTKRYRILRGPFRHGVEIFSISFEAVCVVLCQYQIEYDEPLYDVLIEDILQEESRRRH
jgi:DDE superfamily endonuclease